MKALTCEELQNLGTNLVQELQQGHTFLLVHNGAALAQIQPIARDSASTTQRAAIEHLKAFGRRHPLGDLNIRDMIDEGRH